MKTDEETKRRENNPSPLAARLQTASASAEASNEAARNLDSLERLQRVQAHILGLPPPPRSKIPLSAQQIKRPKSQPIRVRTSLGEKSGRTPSSAEPQPLERTVPLSREAAMPAESSAHRSKGHLCYDPVRDSQNGSGQTSSPTHKIAPFQEQKSEVARFQEQMEAALPAGQNWMLGGTEPPQKHNESATQPTRQPVTRPATRIAPQMPPKTLHRGSNRRAAVADDLAARQQCSDTKDDKEVDHAEFENVDLSDGEDDGYDGFVSVEADDDEDEWVVLDGKCGRGKF